MRSTQKKSKTPPKKLAKQFQTFELNNAIYQGDTMHFKRDGFGTILSDDGSYFMGMFCRDQLKGPGALFFSNSMLYSDFQKGHLQGPSILKQGEFIWCGVLENSKPTQDCYIFNQTTQIWSIVQKPEIQLHLQWPDLPGFIDLKFQKLLKQVLSFDFQFLKTDSLAYDNFGILWPPPSVKLIYEPMIQSDLSSSRELLKPIFNKDQHTHFVYLGYLTLNNNMELIPENLIPHGIGLFIDHITLKVHLSGHFEKGWLEGLGRQHLDSGDIIEGNYRRSTLSGLGLHYTSFSDSYVYGIYDKNQIIEIKLEGIGQPKNLLTQMAQKIHQSSIQYMNQTISWKKLLGVDFLGLFNIFTGCRIQKQANKENSNQHFYIDLDYMRNTEGILSASGELIQSNIIKQDPSMQQLSKQNSLLQQNISYRLSQHHQPPIKKYQHPQNFEKYYQTCNLEETSIHSINNRMNNYGEFNNIIANSTNKMKSYQIIFTHYVSENNYEGIAVFEEKDIKRSIKPSTNLISLDSPMSPVFNQISSFDRKQFHDSLIVSQLFKDNYLDSPQFNNQSIKSVMDSQLKVVQVFEQFPGKQKQLSKDSYKYDFAWNKDQSPSNRNNRQSTPRVKKRIFDQLQTRSVTRRLSMSSSQTIKK